MLFKAFGGAARPIGILKCIFLAGHERIRIVAPFVAILLVEMAPTHLARDNLIPMWVVDIFLEQLHVFLRLLILLLEKALPIVFIPSALSIVLGHGFI